MNNFALAKLPKAPFRYLNQLDLGRCPGVTGKTVIELLRHLDFDSDRVGSHFRLSRLKLAGCDVQQEDLEAGSSFNQPS